MIFGIFRRRRHRVPTIIDTGCEVSPTCLKCELVCVHGAGPAWLSEPVAARVPFGPPRGVPEEGSSYPDHKEYPLTDEQRREYGLFPAPPTPQ